MYIAEIRGKFSEEGQNKEDILTSNVFSFFKYADRRIYLKKFLEKLDIDLQISVKDAENAVFEFWPRYDDRTEPDVIIDVGDYYILFEAKYKSDFGKETVLLKEQIIRELEGGSKEAQNRKKDFRFVAITADYNEPKEKFEQLKKKCTFRWINWHFVTLFLERILEREDREQSIARDLYDLLQKKGLRKFNGFLDERLMYPIKAGDYLYFDYRSTKYRGKFIGFSNAFLGWDKKIGSIKTNIFWGARHGQNTNE
jgi:hypothetical protein